MEYIDCANSLNNTVIRNTINFWSKNSFEHITSILNASKDSQVILFPEYEKELKVLFNEFKSLHEKTSVQQNTNIYFIAKNFLDVNEKFICLLEKLKFEGFNGYAESFEKLCHYTYEQKYASQLLYAVYPVHSRNNCPSVIFSTEFSKNKPFHTLNKCIYTQLYFWSIIGAQHPNFILNSLPDKNALPEKIKFAFNNATASFNLVAFKLSNIFFMLDKKEIKPIYELFKKTNESFFNALYELKNSDILIPKNVIPSINHIMSEHAYITSLTESFDQMF